MKSNRTTGQLIEQLKGVLYGARRSEPIRKSREQMRDEFNSLNGHQMAAQKVGLNPHDFGPGVLERMNIDEMRSVAKAQAVSQTNAALAKKGLKPIPDGVW
jgi:hypothetical protein